MELILPSLLRLYSLILLNQDGLDVNHLIAWTNKFLLLPKLLNLEFCQFQPKQSLKYNLTLIIIYRQRI